MGCSTNKVLYPAGPNSNEGLTKDEVSAVIRGANPKIAECYKKTLKTQNIQGKIIAHIFINESGSVDKAETIQKQNQGSQIVDTGSGPIKYAEPLSTLQNPELEECLKAELKTLKFPKPRSQKQVDVFYPFVFKSNAN